MSREFILDESASGFADAQGRITVSLGPRTPNQTWKVSSTAVQCNSSTETTAKLYRGYASPQNLLGGTYSGNQDANDTSFILTRGNIMTVVWEGAMPGAQGVVSVNGTLIVG